MEFKVGDRVRFIENSMLHEGIIIENCGRWDGYLYDNYLVKSMIGEFNILAPGLVLDNCINETKLKDLEQRIEKLEKCVMGEQKPIAKLFTLDRKEPLEIILGESNKETKTSLLTEDERVILRNLDKKWKWIARDADGGLFVYEGKPERRKSELEKVYWFPTCGYTTSLSIFSHLFEFVKFDDEPYNIEELLKGECGNEN